MNKTRLIIQTLLNDGPWRIFTACTGGGAGLAKTLWSIPGASQYLVGSAFPYAKEATIDFLGFEPEKFCHEDTALHLAMEAYRRAWKPGKAHAVGVGLTASVATLREHRGGHCIYSAAVTSTGASLISLLIPKGVGDNQRRFDGALCTRIGLNTLLQATGRPTTWRTGFEKYDGLEWHQVPSDRLQDVFFGYPFFAVDGRRQARPPDNHNHYPGAFNPPHEGHFGMARAVERHTTQRTIFNVTATSPHKGRLSVPEMLQRTKALRGHPVLFTRGDPFYKDKSHQFPHAGFVIGADALKRMFDPKWGYDVGKLANIFRVNATTFYVFGRERDGVWFDPKEVCQSLNAPEAFKPIAGRWDVSSTEIRNAS